MLGRGFYSYTQQQEDIPMAGYEIREEFPSLMRSNVGKSPSIASPDKVPSPTANRGYVSSYASLIDPDKGLSLNFIESEVINGTKITKIDHQDVASEINYWNQAILCTVLEANPPLGGFIRRIWNQYGIDKVVAAWKGLYLVRFHSLEDKEAVLQKGIYYFDGKPFIINAWNEELELDESSINSLPIWSLSKLGSLLGIPLKADRHTKDKTFLNYARAMIDITLDGLFPDFVEYVNDKGIVTRQTVRYEWKPLKCSYCNMYRHIDVDCKKKEPRKEWRVMEQRPGIEQEQAQPIKEPFKEPDYITLRRELPHNLRSPLKHLNISKYRDIYGQLALSRAQLEATQNQLHQNPLNQHLQAQEREDRPKYPGILDSSIKLLRQQSKLEWLNQGDQCSKFFFAKMKHQWCDLLKTQALPKPHKEILHTMFTTTIYYICKARNELKHQGRPTGWKTTALLIKEHIRQRTLYIAHHNRKYQKYIDLALQK
ncbi:hypothetical protein Cgig2_032642 [Carnegiea gigantea]|uniref:DUF4283 domain-containing protein n=1 Tax=Carnegiea gigantea TaxID=171969 RepID=A0A9Q1GT64_9CARY|nr:hypothetical protein Cgig2_032642 [Carnegiea gigantea]